MKACLVGSTGLVGSHILSTLPDSTSITSISAYTRKPAPTLTSPKTTYIHDSDTSKWPTLFPSDSKIFISALGTTRSAAGSLSAQRTIDYDLNLSLAKAAKASGASVYVLISSGGASSSSMIPYSRMKIELDDAVCALGFERTVIVRPGLLVGARKDSRPPEFLFRKVAGFLGAVSGGLLKDFWAQDAEVVARAAVRAALDAVQGRQTEAVRVLSQADIVRLGRTEWKDGGLS
ncbi:hypothetical protein MBLNU457_6627t1 [Dothideomycetes sp. NU457]